MSLEYEKRNRFSTQLHRAAVGVVGGRGATVGYSFSTFSSFYFENLWFLSAETCYDHKPNGTYKNFLVFQKYRKKCRKLPIQDGNDDKLCSTENSNWMTMRSNTIFLANWRLPPRMEQIRPVRLWLQNCSSSIEYIHLKSASNSVSKVPRKLDRPPITDGSFLKKLLFQHPRIYINSRA